MDKDELILLIALIHSGLDRFRSNPDSLDDSQRAKLEGCELLVRDIDRKILSY